jgi:hypothetical protein
MNMALSSFSLTSRVAGETKGEYARRLIARKDELTAKWPTAEWTPAFDGVVLTYEDGKPLAYVSYRGA